MLRDQSGSLFGEPLEGSFGSFGSFFGIHERFLGYQLGNPLRILEGFLGEPRMIFGGSRWDWGLIGNLRKTLEVYSYNDMNASHHLTWRQNNFRQNFAQQKIVMGKIWIY